MLELFIYMGQFQLATEDALYSDGRRYKPMKMAFKELREELKIFNNVLFLGGGLCSGMQMLEHKGVKATYTIVEIDEEIIAYAKELYGNNAQYICADAQNYMHNNIQQYDLVVIDIFEGRVPADFVTNEDFLLACRKALTTNGVCVLNYIVNGYPLWEDALEKISTVFPRNTVLEYDINRIVVARA